MREGNAPRIGLGCRFRCDPSDHGIDDSLLRLSGSSGASTLGFRLRGYSGEEALCVEHLALRELGRLDEAEAVHREILAEIRARGQPEAVAANILGNLAADLFHDHETAEPFFLAIVADPPDPVALLFRLARRAQERGALGSRGLGRGATYEGVGVWA